MKNTLNNRQMNIISFCACVSIFTFFFLFFFIFGNNLIRKFYFDTFIPIFLSSVLLTGILYDNFLKKHKRLLQLVAIPGMLLLFIGFIGLVMGTYFPREGSKEYEACRETATNTYKQLFKEKGYPRITIDLKKEDQWLWVRYLDELPKCDKYK